MQFIDSHCHIHFDDYPLDAEAVMETAARQNVTRFICSGCTVEDSQKGVDFALAHDAVWATVGLHPHEARRYVADKSVFELLEELASGSKVVGVGEIGLDYHYDNSPRKDQIQVLEYQLDVAHRLNLPVVLHVREAFDDFWPVFDNFPGLRGVMHSFTDNRANLERGLERGLYVGINGIATFAKDPEQIAVYKTAPLDKILLETDAPYLTPVPFRGTICEPKHIVQTAEFLSKFRGEPLEMVAAATTANTEALYNLTNNIDELPTKPSTSN